MLRCAQSPRSDVLTGQGLSAKREGFSLLALSSLLFALGSARLASEILLSSLQPDFPGRCSVTGSVGSRG
jgi:hypothetical protein